MTLPEFIALIKDNIDGFTQDYYANREKATNPDEAYPLANTRQGWFTDFDIWLHIQDVERTIAESLQENEKDDAPQSNSVEFNLESFE